MKTILRLKNVNYTINLNNKQDEKNIIEHVQEDFRQYTRGTNADYRNADKLSYLDMIRGRLYTDSFDEYVENYINDTIKYQKDVGIFNTSNFEIDFDYDFAEGVYRKGLRGFYQSGETDTIYNNLATIIKAVMDYE